MANLIDAKEKRQKRANLAAQAKEILTGAATAGRAMTAEENQRFDKLHEEIEQLGTEARAIERQEDLERELAATRTTPTDGGDRNTPDNAAERGAAYRKAFGAFLRGGVAALAPEERQVLQSGQREVTPEMRALAVGTGGAGGFTVPDEDLRGIISAQKQWGGMRRSRATIVPTTTGASLPISTDNDTTNSGALLGENTQDTEQDVVFGQKTLDAYVYTSKIIRVSFQLLQDSAFNLEDFLRRKFAERLGRITNAHYTTGTGTAQPNGVVTASTLGKTGATGQTTSVTYNDLVDLKHSVDPAYRQDAEFMFNDSTLKAIKKLKDVDNRPLWAPGIAVREPDTIDGDRYVINQDVAVMAANAKSILYGDFSTYWIRDVQDMTVLRLVERYADFLQVGFLAFQRTDGELIDAGTNPIKHYANSAT